MVNTSVPTFKYVSILPSVVTTDGLPTGATEQRAAAVQDPLAEAALVAEGGQGWGSYF